MSSAHSNSLRLLEAEYATCLRICNVSCPVRLSSKEFPFPFPSVTLRLFGPSARPSLAPRCWPGGPSACHIGRQPCGSAAPHPLYAAPGGDLPRSGCSYRPGITGTPACPLMGARRGSASSQLCGCDFLPPPRGDLPRSGVAFRSSSSSRPPTARLKGRTI